MILRADGCEPRGLRVRREGRLRGPQQRRLGERRDLDQGIAAQEHQTMKGLHDQQLPLENERRRQDGLIEIRRLEELTLDGAPDSEPAVLRARCEPIRVMAPGERLNDVVVRARPPGRHQPVAELIVDGGSGPKTDRPSVRSRGQHLSVAGPGEAGDAVHVPQADLVPGPATAAQIVYEVDLSVRAAEGQPVGLGSPGDMSRLLRELLVERLKLGGAHVPHLEASAVAPAGHSPGVVLPGDAGVRATLARVGEAWLRVALDVVPDVEEPVRRPGHENLAVGGPLHGGDVRLVPQELSQTHDML